MPFRHPDRPRRIQHAHRLGDPRPRDPWPAVTRPVPRGRSSEPVGFGPPVIGRLGRRHAGPGLISVLALAVVVLAIAAGAGWTLSPASAAASGSPAAPAARATLSARATTPTPGAQPSATDDAPGGSLSPATPGELTGYAWPLQGARLTNAFGVGRPGTFLLDGQRVHDGIDISSFCGAPITAAHDGVILAAGRHYDEFLGWVGDLTAYRARLDADKAWNTIAIAVVVDDGNGYRSVYAHLRKEVVSAGQQVKAGDLLGYEGATGNATGCHLHYGLFSPDEPTTYELDPKIVAKAKLPDREIARIDPLLVLPPMETASIAWGWGARDEP